LADVKEDSAPGVSPKILDREELSLRLAGEAAKQRASEPPLVQARELRDGQHEDVVLCYQLRCHK